MIQNDPKRHMFSIDNKHHILNNKNSSNQTPLYVGAKNGHLDVVQFLLERGANPHIKSYVSVNEKESLLDVSIRWSHIQIVEYLLKNVKWTRKEIQMAYKNVADEDDISVIKVALKSYSKRKFGGWFAICQLTRCLLAWTSTSKVTPY